MTDVLASLRAKIAENAGEKDEPVELSFDEAALLLAEGDRVHTYVEGGVMLLGADWDRDEALRFLRVGKPQLAGPAASGMGHGLVARRLNGDGTPVFFATRDLEAAVS